MSQPVGMHREVEGCAAQAHHIGKYIPQNFTNAKDCHLGPYNTYKNFRLGLTEPLAYDETVGRFVHADSSQSQT